MGIKGKITLFLIGLVASLGLGLHFVPKVTEDYLGYSYTYWFPSGSNLLTTISNTVLKLRDNQIFRLGDDDDVTIAYDSANDLYTHTSNKQKFNANCITIGKGTADCSADNSVALGKFFTNTTTDSLQIGWAAGNNVSTLYSDVNGIILGDVSTVLNSGDRTSFDALRVYGTNIKFEQTNFTMEPSSGSAVTYTQNAYGAGANITLQRANGTKAVPTNINNGAQISNLSFNGYHSGTYYRAAQIRATVDAAIGGTAETPARLGFFTTPDGSTTLTESGRLNRLGNWYFGRTVADPTAKVHIAAGTATASTAPLKFTAGTNLTVPEAGAVEWNGTDLFLTNSSTTPQRYALMQGIYGSMYNNSDTTITVGSSNTWYEVTTGMSTGTLSGISFDGSHYLQVSVAGNYKVDYSMALETASSNQEIAGAVTINGTAQEETHGHATIVSANKSVNISGTGILSLAANDQISLSVENHDSASNIIMTHANLTLLRLSN